MRLLGSLAPNWCYGDREVVQSLFSSKAVFPKLDNPHQRSQFLANVLSVDGMIFTLHTFFEDANYIGVVMKRMRSLLPPEVEDSTITAMKKCYTGKAQQTGHCIVQFGIQDERCVRATESQSKEWGYLQLCLSIIRYYPEPNKGKNSSASYRGVKLKAHGVNEPPPFSLFEFASLAFKLGFETDEIRHYRDELNGIRAGIRKRRPDELFNIDDAELEQEAQREQEANKKIFQPKPIAPQPVPELTTDSSQIESRCGKPSESSRDFDSRYLFLPTLCNAKNEAPKRSLTSFAAKMLVFFAFFGRPDFNHTDGTGDLDNTSVINSNINNNYPDQCEQTNSMVPRSSSSLYSSPEEPPNALPPHDAIQSPTPEPNHHGLRGQLRGPGGIYGLRQEAVMGNELIFVDLDSGVHLKFANTPEGIEHAVRSIGETKNSPTYGAVKERRLKTIHPKDIYKDANQPGWDPPGFIFYLDGSSRLTRFVFGADFETCLQHTFSQG